MYLRVGLTPLLGLTPLPPVRCHWQLKIELLAVYRQTQYTYILIPLVGVAWGRVLGPSPLPSPNMGWIHWNLE